MRKGPASLPGRERSSLWQPCLSQTIRERCKILRAMKVGPIPEIGNSKRGLKVAKARDCRLRVF